MPEILLGFIGGILVGATGSGFGSLIAPFLLLMGYRPGVAVGTNLGVLVASKFFGAITHHQLGHWPDRSVWPLLFGGLGGVVLVALTASFWLTGLLQADGWLARMVGGSLIAVSLLLFAQDYWKKLHRPAGNRGGSAALFAVGMGTAVPVTLTSAGSGSVLVPALALVTDWTPSQLAATSNLFGWVVGALGVVLFSRAGQFAWPLFAKVLLGVLPGLWIGARVSRRIPRVWLLRGLGAVGVLLGTRLLLR